MNDPNTKWKDEDGRIWILRLNRYNQLAVYNEELGWGLWQNGEGLEQIHQQTN